MATFTGDGMDTAHHDWHTANAPATAPEPRPISANPARHPETFAGHYWCPECDGQLTDPAPGDTHWHHLSGERGECRWTD